MGDYANLYKRLLNELGCNPREDSSLPNVRLPEGHSWNYVKKLGEGGEGTAHLWAHVDSNQKIVEHIVIKNTTVRNQQLVEGRWLELYIQQRLAPHGSTDACTVPILAAEQIPGYGRKEWRTYMHYYGKGDFRDIILGHTVVRPLPEPFLWFVFYRLAKALVDMSEEWRKSDESVVVHRDIKPANILMGSPGSLGKDEDYIAYPPAYLGDFGLAYLTSNDNSWVKKLDCGTRGYYPPELRSEPMPLNIQRRPPGSEANVWQVGETMLVAMMGGKHPGDGPQGHVYRNTTHWRHLIENGQWSGYSRDLIELAESCVKYDMDLRPPPMDILVSIKGFMPEHDDGMNRWGTLSWIKAQSSKIDGSLLDEDAQHEDAGHETGAGVSTAAGAKRKASGPPTMPPDAKRSKAETALRRRLVTVATEIKGHRPKLHADDEGFSLRQTLKLIYRNEDSMFDPETFFDAADPGPIKFLELGPTANDDTKKVKTREIDGVVYIDDDDG
ncbi:kinase-like protein, partial [Aureobasidium melanogenum]